MSETWTSHQIAQALLDGVAIPTTQINSTLDTPMVCSMEARVTIWGLIALLYKEVKFTDRAFPRQPWHTCGECKTELEVPGLHLDNPWDAVRYAELMGWQYFHVAYSPEQLEHGQTASDDCALLCKSCAAQARKEIDEVSTAPKTRKIWLDDHRVAPGGWEWVKTPEEVIEAIQDGDVERVSLDHDLGLFGHDGFGKERTGMDVLLWLEEVVLTGSLKGVDVPLVRIHTGNPVAGRRMRHARNVIARCLHAQGIKHWSRGLDEVKP